MGHSERLKYRPNRKNLTFLAPLANVVTLFRWAKGEELSILQNRTFYFGEPP
jgi:hypothetical protein